MMLSQPEFWQKIRIVHCGVDAAMYEAKRHKGPARRLLFVGRLVAAKGVCFLLETIARIDDAILDIAGDGPERKFLEAKAASLGISRRVHFLGYRSQAQVRELLRQADVFVMASFAEGLPVVPMEAMGAGVPVVATRIAGIPELVDDGRMGFLFRRATQRRPRLRFVNCSKTRNCEIVSRLLDGTKLSGNLTSTWKRVGWRRF